MIQIRKLSLKNFKSFRKAEMPIARGFTAIVGSNGSGKSNILDALLFVLGISSLKALRASRMTDLVNNQSTEDYAKVEIELEDKEKNKGWVVSRTIDKQGRSIMRLDDKRVSLNEVTSLLEELGITPTGHNIVVQGDITRIMEMNAMQRREMIDDAAGIREFDEKREESFKELEKVEQRIKEVRIVLSERETFLQELAKEREAALEYNRLSEELNRTKSTIFFGEIREIQEKLDKNSQRKTELENDRLERTNHLAEEKNEADRLEKVLEEQNQQLIGASEKTYSGLGLLVEEKRSEKKVREERLKSLQEQLEKNQHRISNFLDRNQAILKEVEQKKNALEEQDQHIRELEASLEQQRTELDAKRSSWSAKNKELKVLEEAVQTADTERTEKQREFFEKQSIVQTQQKTVEIKKRLLVDLTKEHQQLVERLAHKNKKKELLDVLLQKDNTPEKTAEQLEKQIRENQQQSAYLESKLDSLNESVRLLEKSIANCPTCDATLSEATQKRILHSKKTDSSKAARELSVLNEKRTALLDQKDHLATVLRKKRELEIELGDLLALQQKATELEEKIRSSKAELEGKSLIALEHDLKHAEKELAEAERVVQEAEQNLHQFKQQHDFDALSKQSGQIEQLSRRLNEEKGHRKQLELETTLVLVEETKSNDQSRALLDQENQSLHARTREETGFVEKIERELEKLELELAKAEKATRELGEKKKKTLEKLAEQKQKIARSEGKLKEIELLFNQLEIDSSKLQVRETDLKEEAKSFEGIAPFDSFDLKDLRQKLPLLEKQIQKLGAINQKAVEHFGEFEQELLDVKKKSEKLEEERLAVLDMIKKIEDRRTSVFMDCFNAIARHFNNIFFTLADGEGKLSLTTPEKPLESGLLIEARMKGKPIYSIDSMSGGEKTLTGLAFLFAIQLYRPAPFYVFDEADAALDKENSLRLGKIIGQISQNGQFIGITHNDTIVREANQIIGVALNEQKSSVVGLRLRETPA